MIIVTFSSWSGETASLLGRPSRDAELIAASSCCFRLELAKRNHKLTPEVRLPAVIHPQRPLPTSETDGRRTAGERLTEKPVYAVVVVTLHHLAWRCWRDTLLVYRPHLEGHKKSIYCCLEFETEKLLRNLTKCVPMRKCNYCIFRDVWIERSDALIDSKDTNQGQGTAAYSRLTFLLLLKPQWRGVNF